MPLPASYSNIPNTMRDGDDAGDATPGSTAEGLLAGRINDLADAVTGLEPITAQWTNARIFNVESPTYGAVSDKFFVDGVAVASDNTFTSATANFAAPDVGKQVVIGRVGGPGANFHHSTIASVTNSTTVELTVAPAESWSQARFYLSRGATAAANTTAIQNAINACEAAGGGIVYLPGVGYWINGLVMGSRVWLMGAGRRATMLHLNSGQNGPVITNEQTLNSSAEHYQISDLLIEGNYLNQADISTTLASSYTVGNTTLSLTNASAFQNAGTVLLGGFRLQYMGKTGNTLTDVSGGWEGTTASNQSSGATISQRKGHGIFLMPNPYTPPGGVTPAGVETFDPCPRIYRVDIEGCWGCGFQAFGQWAGTIHDVHVTAVREHGFQPSYDTVMSDCISANVGRAGFYLNGPKTNLTGCSAFNSGSWDNSSGHGFFFEGPSWFEDGGRMVINAASQDNRACGVNAKYAQRIFFSGVLDSNGISGTEGQYAAVRLEGCTNGFIDATCVERRFDGVNKKQQNALEIVASTLPTTQMDIRLAHGGTNQVAVGPAIKPGSDLTGVNRITINGVELSPWKRPVKYSPIANVAPSTAPTTTLTAATVAGTTVNLAVASSAGFAIGDTLYLTPATIAERAVVTAIPNGTTIQIGTATASVHASSAEVRNVTRLIVGGTSWTPDGTATVNYDRVLLKNQTAAWQNGIYYVQGVGTAVFLLRSQDADVAEILEDGSTVAVGKGTVNKDSKWTLVTDVPFTLGIGSLRWTREQPAYDYPASGPSARGFTNTGAVLSNMDRTQSIVAALGTTALTTQVIRVFPLGVLRAGAVAAAINFFASAAAATITASWAGIARASDRLVLARSNNSTTSTGTNPLTFTFAASYTADEDLLIYGFLMYQATTLPNLFGVNQPSANLLGTPAVNGDSTTGQGTTPPTAGTTTLIAITADTEIPYAYLT